MNAMGQARQYMAAAYNNLRAAQDAFAEAGRKDLVEEVMKAKQILEAHRGLAGIIDDVNLRTGTPVMNAELTNSERVAFRRAMLKRM